MAGSNSLEFRWAVKTLNGVEIDRRLQFRTKDVTASVLGVLPLASSWSAWQDIDTDIVQVPVTP